MASPGEKIAPVAGAVTAIVGQASTRMATVARALKRDLDRRGVEASSLHAFVPVSVRQPSDERTQPGNEVSGMVVDLPLSCPDVVDCLDRISRVTSVIDPTSAR